MTRKLTREEFIRRAREVHGDKYDYSKVVYINNATKVLIKCNKCGTVFEQTPNCHVSKRNGCPNCSRERTKKFLKHEMFTKDEFVRRARLVHGDKYNYDKSEYAGYDTPITITCERHGDFLQRPHEHLHGAGCIKCAMEEQSRLRTGVSSVKSKKVFGIGINDYDGVVRTLGKTIDSYRHWKSMLERCPSEKYSWYKDCSVCDEWLYFSNFKKWFDDPANGYREGYCLDKDILVKGNKIYSPDTCCFVPRSINTIFVKRKADRGDLPIGVQKKPSGRYACIMDKYCKIVHVGTFDTPEEAFAAYKREKEAYIKEVAQKYYDNGEITERVYDALMRYEVEITD